MTTEIVDPFFDWTLREDGRLSIKIHAPDGELYVVHFTTYEPFANLRKGLGDAEHAMNILEDDGFAVAARFAIEIAQPIVLSDDDVNKLLGG